MHAPVPAYGLRVHPTRSAPPAALLATVLWLGPAGALPAKAPGPTPVTVAEVRKDRFVDRVEALGTLIANESVSLTATVTEVVDSLNFEDGQRVRKGDVLATLSATEEQALLIEARATAEEAKKQYDRARQLATSGAAAASQLDEARRVHDTARARQAAIESRVDQLTVRAPFDGRVGLRNLSVGALVRPGDLITTIDDDSVMKLDFQVPSTFLPVLRPGTPIEARARAFPDRTFRGDLRSVSSRIDPVTRSVTARAEIPNPERLLKPGLLMTVELLSNPRDAVALPEAALLPAGRGNTVMVVDRTGAVPVARRREVTVGTRRPGEVEVVTGLEPGETVVVDGGFKLAEGAPVAPVAGIPAAGEVR